KSSGFVKKGKRDQDSDSSDDEGNTYFEEAFVAVENDEITELVLDSGGSYHMTQMRDFLYDLKGFDGGSIQLGDNRTCTINETGKVKIQLHDKLYTRGCQSLSGRARHPDVPSIRGRPSDASRPRPSVMDLASCA
nr:zinc finger, CCHC-type [Tanacetum cinerariifolium]